MQKPLARPDSLTNRGKFGEPPATEKANQADPSVQAQNAPGYTFDVQEAKLPNVEFDNNTGGNTSSIK